MSKKFFKQHMEEKPNPETPAAPEPETAAPAPAVPTQAPVSAPLQESVVISPMDADPMPTGTAPPGTSLESQQETVDPRPTSGSKTYTLGQLVMNFVPCDSTGQPHAITRWEDILEKPGVMCGIIGAGKVWASAAAQHKKCWTVTKHGDDRPKISAGMNSDDSDKVGYLITQKPWGHLDDVVLPLASECIRQ
jgi:hypothetical protein